MKGPRKTRKLVVTSAFQTPKILPPTLGMVQESIMVDPQNRTNDQIQVIFRHLLLNDKILDMVGKTINVEKLAKKAEYIRIHKGDVLFFEGDDPDGWYVVLSGNVDVIIRLFLVAEDCLFDADSPSETTEFAPLMDMMDLDVQHDKLRRIAVLKPNEVFGTRAFILNTKRSATIVAASEVTELIKLPTKKFRKYAYFHEQSLYNDHFQIIHGVFPRLRDDQVMHIASLANLLKLKQGTSITTELSYGQNIYIVKSGTMARYRVVDFTPLSFRVIEAPFESLRLHFPDGFHPVHTDDLTTGSVFVDPTITEMSDSEFNVKTTSDVELLALDLDYFRIIVGEFELERVRQEIRSTLTDDQVIQIWIDSKKARLWEKFKQKTSKEAKKYLKTDRLVKVGNYAIRTPAPPKSNKAYVPRKVVPYAPSHLAKPKSFAEPMEY